MAPHGSLGSDRGAPKVWGSWQHIPSEIAAISEGQELQAHFHIHPHHVSFQKQPVPPIEETVPHGGSHATHSQVWVSGLEILPVLGVQTAPPHTGKGIEIIHLFSQDALW